MLRVLVEIWPGGSEEFRRPVADLRIANVTDGLPETSNYEYALADNLTSTTRNPPDTGTVLRHKRSHGWLPLVRRVLQDVDKQRALHYRRPRA